MGNTQQLESIEAALHPTPVRGTKWNADSEAFAFTNESLEGLFGEVDHNGKTVFGITGSGDYQILAALNGCAAITCIDISRFANAFAELKIEAMKVLDLEEFLAFFAVPEYLKKAFSLNKLPNMQEAQPSPMYSRQVYVAAIRDGLSQEARDFFDNILGHDCVNLNNIQMPLALNYLIGKRTSEDIRSQPPFRTPDEYIAAQKALRAMPKVSYNNGDIHVVIDDLGQKFDIAYLSNVLERTSVGKSLLGRCMARLAPGGVVIAYGAASLEANDFFGYGFTPLNTHSPDPNYRQGSICFRTAYLIRNNCKHKKQV